LYICIEIKSREYDSQILLAAYAARRGYRVYLGTHAAIYALLRKKKKKEGILLDKSTQPRERMLWLRKKVDRYCILDAELSPILIETVAREEFPTRIYEDTIESIDKYFVVGPAMANVAKEFFKFHSSIVRITGWPRIDVWSTLGEKIYAKEVDVITATYGDFLLLVSSFGQIRDPKITKNLRSADIIRDAELNSRARRLEQYENFKRVVSIIRELDAEVDTPTIIVRPHPSESISVWRKQLRNLKKTFVIQGGDVSPWIFASKGLIHNGSTTSIQGHFAGKNLIMLNEFTSKSYIPIPEAISQYLLTDNSEFKQLDFSGLPLNPRFNPSLLDAMASMPPEGAINSVINELDDLGVKSSLRSERFPLILSQFNFRSLKRGLGLARDEFYWKFGMINITPQMHVVPGGLDIKRIRIILATDEELYQVRYRRMTLNLWEFEC
jgi:surface carbohydrate biosynthesis protein